MESGAGDVLYGELAEFYEPLYRSKLGDAARGISFECDLLEGIFKKEGEPGGSPLYTSPLLKQGTVNTIYEYDKKSSEKKLARVLDAGCGTGIHCLELAKRGYDVTGFDLSGEMLAIARKREAVAKTGAKFFPGNMSNFDFGQQSFDAVISMHNAAMHLPSAGDFEKMLACTNRALVDGGLFVVDFSDYEKMVEKGEFGEVFVDRFEREKTSVIEVSENVLNSKERLLHERNTYFISRDGETYRKLEMSGDLLLLKIANLDGFFSKTGFERVDALDLDTGKPANEDSVELVVAAKKVSSV